MNYERPMYLDERVKTAKSKIRFNKSAVKVPVLERPISIRENFIRAYKRQNPLWVPDSRTDITGVMIAVLTGAGEADWSRKDRYDWQDWFGVQWIFVPEAGGPMLKPGTQYLDDILNWEKKVKFPDLNDYDIERLCKKFMETYDREKILHVNIGLGCTERLVALLGGYTEAMVAMALEPDAVRDFLNAFADFEIKVVDKLLQHVPVDMMTYNDDWGTERDTFFSEKMMEEIVFEPTKKLFGHIKSKDVCLEHHCCGNIKRFLPYMLQLGADFIQIQARANDIRAYKKKWGDGIGFNINAMPTASDSESVIKSVRDMVDNYASGGGVYGTVFAAEPEAIWTATTELYYYSREFYEAEQGQ